MAQGHTVAELDLSWVSQIPESIVLCAPLYMSLSQHPIRVPLLQLLGKQFTMHALEIWVGLLTGSTAALAGLCSEVQ